MNHRLCTSLNTVAMGVVVLSLSAVPAAAQTDTPRTAWGQPDLQGVWDFRSITPMQRPEEQADKEFLTEEEAAQIEQDAVDRDIRLWNRDSRRTEAGESVGGYNNFWLDRGLKNRRNQAHVADHRSAEREDALADAGRTATSGRATGVRQRAPRRVLCGLQLGVRCILGFNAGPPFTPSAYNNNMQLFQTPDHVVLMTEMVNTARVVPLDGRPELDPDVRQWSGDSRGYWEGDTLVIETRNFDAKRRWRGTTKSMRLVERLTRVDAETLVYEFTVTDPETWTSSWTASVPLVLNPEPMFEYACHEGNYSMPVMLGGQRALEK